MMLKFLIEISIPDRPLRVKIQHEYTIFRINLENRLLTTFLIKI